ncbi:MAG: hypothetical protein IPJ39_00890 [Saprospiraceae bacterium]|nr:hypothetical protein [Saprospiraceae bacterium]
MSFQTVVRDGNQTLLKSTNIGIQISILQGSDDGNSVYAERHFHKQILMDWLHWK